MLNTLLVCSMLFQAPNLAPDAAQLYREAYDDCGTSTATTPARVPLQQITDYFPAEAHNWPVLRAEDPALLTQVNALVDTGIRPGVLLPQLHAAAPLPAKLRRRLTEARSAGALPIAQISGALPAAQRAARYRWCLSDLCPVAWYLPDGLRSDVSRLAPGLYLAAPHWQGHTDWPLPPRLLSLDSSHKIMPLLEYAPAAGGSAAVFDPNAWRTFASGPPRTTQHWRWLGIDFVADADGVYTGILGNAMLLIGGGCITLWQWSSSAHVDLLALISSNFSWAVLILGLINILTLIMLTLLRRRTIGHSAEEIA